MADPYPNKFGRVGGRGLRPWLLVPKILGLVVYVGGFCAVLTLWLASDFTSLNLADPRRAIVLKLVSHILVYLIVPAATITIVFGILLLMQHPLIFLKMRWMQVKLIALLLLVPSCHLYARYQYTRIKTTTDKQISNEASVKFQRCTMVAIAGSMAVIVIGRIKPRFGQSHPSLSGTAGVDKNAAA